MTVCGATFCTFSRHQGDRKPECLENKAQTAPKQSCHENALSVTKQTHICKYLRGGGMLWGGGTIREVGAGAERVSARMCGGGGVHFWGWCKVC